MTFFKKPILIVGAGPVGLTLAWLLNEAGINVRLFEAEDKISNQLRASTFHPPTLDLFDDSGISKTLHEYGQITPTWQIRMHETGEFAEFDLGVLERDTKHPYRLQCRQEILSQALNARIPKEVCLFSHPIEKITQDDNGVCVWSKQIEFEGSLVIGCDGARSIVRQEMGTSFDGETYPETTILLTTKFPFENYFPNLSGVNYIWREGGTFSLLRLPDLWRVSLYPAEGQSAEEAFENGSIRAQMTTIFEEGKHVDVIEKRIYKIHRRVAETYRKKRLLIAGDAAHLNSPKGGMGMNGGIHDAWCLAQKLIAIKNGSAIDVLDEYERQRRPIAVEDIGGQSHKNRARMMSSSSVERLKYLRELQEISDSYEKSRKFLLKSSMIEGLKRSETLI